MRFTVANVSKGISMKVDIPAENGVSEIIGTADDVWGCGKDVALRYGYSLLNSGDSIGLKEGGLVEVLPDPFVRCCQIHLGFGEAGRTGSDDRENGNKRGCGFRVDRGSGSSGGCRERIRQGRVEGLAGIR